MIKEENKEGFSFVFLRLLSVHSTGSDGLCPKVRISVTPKSDSHSRCGENKFVWQPLIALSALSPKLDVRDKRDIIHLH